MEQNEYNISKKDLDLLVKELCARLPYDIKFKQTDVSTITLKSIGFGSFGLIPINLFYKKPEFYLINEFSRLEYKPYLRSISTMTEEEWEYLRLLKNELVECDETNDKKFNTILNDIKEFYYSRHIDRNGLIPKGLALEAPKDMYNVK